jgi:hypothetical protein
VYRRGSDWKPVQTLDPYAVKEATWESHFLLPQIAL